MAHPFFVEESESNSSQLKAQFKEHFNGAESED